MGAELRAGLIGAGWIGRQHAEILAARDGITLAAVCDTDTDRAAEVAASSEAEVFGDWRDMLRAGGLDAVWVCTPPQAHHEPAVTALEQGLPVYLEKPIARSLDQGRAIAAAAESAVCAVGYQWHALDVLDDVRRALGGRPVGCLTGQSIGGTQSRPWFLDRDAGGGNLLERGSHHIDLARAIAGEVTAVQAAASRVRLAPQAGNIDDAVTLVLHFAAGGLGTIVVAWTSGDLPGSYWVEVTADRARIRVDLDPDFWLSGVADGSSLAPRAAAPPFARSVDRFLTAVRKGDPGLVFCSPTDALGTLAVAIAAEEALITGSKVAVQPV